jgi:apolipoprotein N-acyltransferase
VRAAITGPSAIFDPFGRAIASLSPRQRGVLTGTVTPTTGQTWYVRLGDAFGAACAVIAVLSALGQLAERRRWSAHRRRPYFVQSRLAVHTTGE